MEGSPRLSCLYTASAVTQHRCVSLTTIERAVEKYCRKVAKCKIEVPVQTGVLSSSRIQEAKHQVEKYKILQERKGQGV